MNFEELEAAWAAQTSTPPPAIDAAALKRTVIPEFKRRGRFLGYTIFACVFFLVVWPLLTVANYRYEPPVHPAWHWTYFSVWVLVTIGFLAAAIRGVQRHGALQQQSTHSLRDLAAASLTSTEAEMREYRTLLWLQPLLIALQLLDLFVKFPVTASDWLPFAGRAAFVVGLPLVLGLAFWRHYRVNLKPARDRQKQLLRELS